MHGKSQISYLSQRRGSSLTLMRKRWNDDTNKIARWSDTTLLKIHKPLTTKLIKVVNYRGGTLWHKILVKTRQSTSRLELK